MAVTPEQVLNKHFQTTQFRKGYDERDVDDFLDEIVAEMRSLLAERDDYKQQLADCRAGRGQSTEAVADAPAQVDRQATDEAETRLAEVRAKVAEADAERVRMVEQVKAAKSERDGLQIKLDGLRGAVAEAQAQAEGVPQQVQDAEAAVADAHRRAEETGARVAEAEARLSELRGEIAEAEQALLALGERSEQAQAKVAEAELRVQDAAARATEAERHAEQATAGAEEA
ncbi:MAG: DivIVA domain-containing protein, partial [Candidatus Phosphoribacter sp.]